MLLKERECFKNPTAEIYKAKHKITQWERFVCHKAANNNGQTIINFTHLLSVVEKLIKYQGYHHNEQHKLKTHNQQTAVGHAHAVYYRYYWNKND